MLLPILLLSLVLCLNNAATNAESSPQQSLRDLEEKLESRFRNMETRFQDEKEKLELRLKEMAMKMENEKEKQAKEKKELEVKINEMEARLMEVLEDRLKEKIVLEERERRLEASTSNQLTSNSSNNALTSPSLRDLPFVLISAWQPNRLSSSQTVTFESFLANYNNGERPDSRDQRYIGKNIIESRYIVKLSIDIQKTI